MVRWCDELPEKFSIAFEIRWALWNWLLRLCQLQLWWWIQSTTVQATTKKSPCTFVNSAYMGMWKHLLLFIIKLSVRSWCSRLVCTPAATGQMVWSERSCSGGNAVASASPSTTFKKSSTQSCGPFSLREGRLHGLELLPGAISLWSLVMSGDAWNTKANENSGEIFVLISFLWLLPLLTRHEHSQANVTVLSSDTYTGIKMGPLVCQNCVDDHVGSKWKTEQSNICILYHGQNTCGWNILHSIPQKRKTKSIFL